MTNFLQHVLLRTPAHLEVDIDLCGLDSLEVLVQLVQRMASRGPVVFAVEDLHWVDPSTLEFLTLLVERLAGERVLAIFTYRPEFSVRWHPQPHQSLSELQRRSDQEIETPPNHHTGSSPSFSATKRRTFACEVGT